MPQEVVREIQEYLRALAFYHPRLLPVTVDGFYGDETKKAVSYFQKEYDLPISGDVDSQTWARLTEAYRLLEDTAVIPLHIFSDEQQRLRPGEETALVPFLQLVLKSLSDLYDNVANIQISGVYDAPTVENVQEIQRLHGMEPNGIVDRGTWNVLAQLYNGSNDAKNFEER